MAIAPGRYDFNKQHGLDWLYCLIVTGRGKTRRYVIKYIYEYRDPATKLQPNFSESTISDVRETVGGRFIGKVNLRKKNNESYTLAFRKKSHLSSDNTVCLLVQGIGFWVESKNFVPETTQKSLRIGKIVLNSCCVTALEKMNKLPGLAGKVDFIGIVGDVAGIVDAGSGLANALNSAAQKASTYGGPSLSSLLSSPIKNQIRTIAISKATMHNGQPAGNFWDSIISTWCSW